MNQLLESRKRPSATLVHFALILVLIPYVLWLVFGYRYHFIDGVNLFLHEAGHVFFGFFGRTAHFLGGTLGQLAFPVAFVVYFFRRRQFFEAGIVAIWFCESLMYTGCYIADARAQALPLVGGHIHDWNWLLSRWGMLRHAETLGQSVHVVASLGAITALAYATRQFMNSSRRAKRAVMDTHQKQDSSASRLREETTSQAESPIPLVTIPDNRDSHEAP